MTVNRRRFLASTFPAAGAATIGLPAGIVQAGAEPQSLPPAIESLLPITAVEPAGITDEERWGRIAKAQRLMIEAELDGIIMLGGTCMLYFADMQWGRSERTFALILSREGQPAWVCPAFERERAVQRIRFGDDIRTWEENESPYALIGSILADRGIRTGRIGLEETTYYHVADGLGRDAPALTVSSADPVMKGCRAVKSSTEIELMRHANRVTLEAMRATFSSMAEGMTQREFRSLLSSAYSRLGYSGGGLVLFGENSAYPHGTDREEEIREGTVVLCDSGTTAGGYRSDITRTAIFGEPSVKQRHVWTLVKNAQTAALEAAGPGVPAGEVDRAARAVIERGGYGPGYRYFSHRVGHGIGMDGHEWHYLVEGNTQLLEPAMTFSNEPGIYIFGSFGIRLEDIMVITGDGADLLTEQAGSPSNVFSQSGRR